MTGPLNSSAPTTVVPVGGVFNITPPNPVATQVSALQVDANGDLLVNVATGASSETSTIFSGTVALVPQFAAIAVSALGASTIVNAVAVKRIRVIALQVIANAAVNIKWQSHTLPTDLTGLAYCSANGGYVLPYNPVGWFQTIAGEALDINLSAAIAVGGSITYVTV